MCGSPEGIYDSDFLVERLLLAFSEYRNYVCNTSYIEKESKNDWVKEFLEDAGKRLREMEKEGKLVNPKEHVHLLAEW
ncbi:hypothetical protein ACFL6U_12285 [Planctomycetota bacterium]